MTTDQSIVSVFNFINKPVSSGYFECGTNSLVEIRILKAELSADLHLNSESDLLYRSFCFIV